MQVAAAAARRSAPACALVIVAVLSLVGPADQAVKELTLPLRHDDIIRQQAADKNVDPALIAGVIYTESRFRDQTSHAGAKGLMQLMPETADYIARKSGGTRFQRADLATPQINIAYGTWYLRYLLDKYKGNTILTLAAYNAGEGKVDEWRANAAAAARSSGSPATSPSRRPATTCTASSARARTIASTTPASSGCRRARNNPAASSRRGGYQHLSPHIRARLHLRRLPHRGGSRPWRHGHRL